MDDPVCFSYDWYFPIISLVVDLTMVFVFVDGYVPLRFVLFALCDAAVIFCRDESDAAAHLWHTRTQYGQTALAWSCWRGHTDCTRLLLDSGGDKEAKSNLNVRVAGSAACVVLWGFGFKQPIFRLHREY